jgi:hypothetical protein
MSIWEDTRKEYSLVMIEVIHTLTKRIDYLEEQLENAHDRTKSRSHEIGVLNRQIDELTALLREVFDAGLYPESWKGEPEAIWRDKVFALIGKGPQQVTVNDAEMECIE